MSQLDQLIQRCTTWTHLNQLQARLLTSGLFHSHPSLRSKFIYHHFTLSPSSSLFNSVHLPTTNDYNAVLRGLASSSSPVSAFSFYSRFVANSSYSTARPDALSLSFTLKACARCAALPFSLQLHSNLVRFGVCADTILMTTLVDAYAKSGSIDNACKVFDEIPQKDIAAWNVFLSGLVLCEQSHLAISLFRQLCTSSQKLNPHEKSSSITIITALSACTQLSNLQIGIEVHSFARERNLDSNTIVKNALIDMYSKCGSLSKALDVFHSIAESQLTLISYNTILQALSMHGQASDALNLFDKMPSHIKPDSITYLTVLYGCNHAGLVEEGLKVFRSMRVSPNIKHYGTIVDLLARSGRLTEAYDTIISMPFEPDLILWHTLLGGAKTYGDISLAELAAEKIKKMGSNLDGDYVLLSNVYASNARWCDVDRVRNNMVHNNVRKIPGFSYMEINGTVHKFVKDDKSHPKWREIYEVLKEIRVKIRELGFVSEVQNVLHDIGEEEKENELCYHSEKLAIAFGLISTDLKAEIRVIKNLRICGDCHSMAKFVSKAYNRVIVVRDRARFHRFEGGECTCKDFW
ncbi:hypothetical protein LUZ60_000984 [Juncus effusus]|nr:hypothetical protein LUZ60_000984 [Juncus effusus]